MPTAPNVTVIPAKVQTTENRDKYHQLRVAAYCRVSTEQEEQQNSYQVQIAYYTDLINRKKEWTLAGVFADEGISGTQTKKRTEFTGKGIPFVSFTVPCMTIFGFCCCFTGRMTIVLFKNS